MINRVFLPDYRFARADVVASHISHALAPLLDRLDPKGPVRDKDIYRVIRETLTAVGVEVLTDYHRAEMGLPPRGPNGWTEDEIHLYEKRLSHAMRTTIPPTFSSLSDK